MELVTSSINRYLSSEVFSKQNNPSQALHHFKLYSQAKDSLTNEKNIRKSVEEELTFDFEKCKRYRKNKKV
jgi:hypothetical protein